MWHWIHPEKLRYYQADLVMDLFGDWTLVSAWGGLGTNRGNHSITGVLSHEDGLRKVEALDAHRRKRGYFPVQTLANWRSLVSAMQRDTPRITRQKPHRGDGLSRELDFG